MANYFKFGSSTTHLMKHFYALLFVTISSLVIANPQAYEPTSPQVVYEMYIDVVEPIHKAYEAMTMLEHKPVFDGKQMELMFRESKSKLDDYHKERLHRNAYTAATVYLDGMKVINDSLLIPLLNEMKDIQTQDELSPLLERLNSIGLEEVPFAENYRDEIMNVIELFKKDWDAWLQQEIIFFSRLTASERNAIYESGFGQKGLNSVKRRFYTAKYFVVNMEKDIADSRVNTISASFKDLSLLPNYMITNVGDFVEQFDIVMENYRYEKSIEEGGDKMIYIKGGETNFEFVVKRIEVTIISKSSNTVKVKFFY